MASVVNFDQLPTGQVFNINLDLFGNLNFNANGQNGGGSTRLAISDDSGQVTIGGSGVFGASHNHIDRVWQIAAQPALGVENFKSVRCRLQLAHKQQRGRRDNQRSWQAL